MTTIHHATQKMADKHEIKLSVHGEYPAAMVLAEKKVKTARGVETVAFDHPDAKIAVAAVALQTAFTLEYPALELAILLEDQNATYLVTHDSDDNDTEVIIYEGPRFPQMADLLNKCQDLGLDPEAGFEEETFKQVVPDRYKREYAQRGNRDNCGDWLAKKLEGAFDTEAGKFDADAFETFLRLNDVDMTGKWAALPTSGQKGWVGRYRMNGRQKLEMVVARVGYFKFDNDGDIQTHKAPAAFRDHLLARHTKIVPE